MTEEWRAVPGFEGAYEVSDQGRVRSLARTVLSSSKYGTPYRRRVPGGLLRPGRMPSGHLSVVLERGRGSRTVHSLVAQAFLGPRPPNLEVRHLDGDPTNNRLNNIEYSSRGRNSQDKKWHAGAKTYTLTPAQVSAIKARLRRGDRPPAIAPCFGVSKSTIYAIRYGVFHRDIA